MRVFASCVAAIALVVAAPAFAQTPAASAEAPAETVKEKKICRPLPARTGSHRPHGKVCKTAAEWRARDKDRYMEGRFEESVGFKPEKRNAGLN